MTGPTHLPPVQSEVQSVTVGGEGGTFTLAHSLSEGYGTITVASGFAETTVGSNIVLVWFPLGGTFKVGQDVTGPAIPSGATIVGISGPASEPSLELSAPATASEGFTEVTASSREITNVTGRFQAGQEIVGTGIPPGTTIESVGPSTIMISQAPTSGGAEVRIASPEVATNPIPFGASAGQVQAALDGLGGPAGTFSVRGGPGVDPGDAYVIAFGGSLGNQDVAEIVTSGSGLGEHGYVHVLTTLPGGPGTGQIAVYPTNVGGAATSGPITLEIGPLPAGVAISGEPRSTGGDPGWWTCNTQASTVRCTSEHIVEPLAPAAGILVPVKVVLPTAAQAYADVTVEGGGTEDVGAFQMPVEVSATPARAGVAALYSNVLEADGTASTQAGAHPYSQVTMFAFKSVRSIYGRVVPVGEVKDVNVDLQAGFVGSPLITPRCPAATPAPFVCDEGSGATVGHLYPGAGEFGALGFTGQDAPIGNAIPVNGAAAEFSTKIVQPVATLLGRVRSNEDFGIRVEAPDNSPFLEVFYIDAVFFGEPPGGGGKAFFRNPTDCAAERQNLPEQRLEASTWQEPSRFDRHVMQLAPVDGCGRLQFNPSFTLQPTSTQGSSSVGATAHLHIDQTGLADPAALATPDLKRSVVTLPEGFNVNPAQAAGLEACSEAEVGYEMAQEPLPLNPTRFNEDPVTCPEASKLGTVEATTPLLEAPLKGTIYLAAQEANPFDSLIGLYLVFESERFGITLKLPGKVDSESSPGHLTATFDYVPQQPIEDLTLHFRGGGPRSEFATPEVCGTYTTQGSWEPWSAPESGAPAQTSSPFTVSSGCSPSADTRPFHPSFEGGAVSPVAGAYSPLVIRINRSDGEQELKSIDVSLPPGETGKLAGVPYCPGGAIGEAVGKTGKQELASPSCPAASQIGTVDTSVGVGTMPLHVPGKVYLAGPYKGAPLSAVVISPAVAGPFDLGDVVIRSPLFVDPETTQITVKSDPIPTVLRGIPLKIRSVAISIDRSDFSLNPTNCEARSISATIGSSDGAKATPSNRFQVGSCSSLKFKPKLQISLRGATKRTGHPALKAVLTYPKGGAYANIARAQVNLPHSEFIEQNNLNKTCTRPVLLEQKCPAKSIYGRAKAWTPLLEQPLQGPVYLVGGFGYKLPALVAELDGQIRVLLKGKVDSGPNKGIRNTFEAVPDAPVEKFILEMKGGPKYSLLINSENLCKRPQRAIARFTAQNGAVLETKPMITNDCRSKKNKKRREGHRKHRRP
jgi:hypothetical protein